MTAPAKTVKPVYRYKIGDVYFHDWRAIPLYKQNWAAVFITNISGDYLAYPPYDMAVAMRELCRKLRDRWLGWASLWIRLDIPGTWYMREFQRGFRGVRSVPLAITNMDVAEPSLMDFTFTPKMDRTPDIPSPAPAEPKYLPRLTSGQWRSLLALSRIRQGTVLEIAAQAGVSPTTVRSAMPLFLDLAVYKNGKERRIGVVSQDGDQWIIRPRNGVSLALRRLGLPPGSKIKREARYTQGPRHLHTSRLWPAWLRQGYPGNVEIWAGWSEPRVDAKRLYPDALAWGTYRGAETLFLLEVESGKASDARLERKFKTRIAKASNYLWRLSNDADVWMIFGVAAPPRTLKTLSSLLSELQAKQDILIPHNMAVILFPWTGFGESLPVPVFGQVSPGIAQLRLL